MEFNPYPFCKMNCKMDWQFTDKEEQKISPNVLGASNQLLADRAACQSENFSTTGDHLQQQPLSA